MIDHVIDWKTAYAILNREYPNSWPTDLSDAIQLRIRKAVEVGNVSLAASIAAQTAAGYYGSQPSNAGGSDEAKRTC